MKEKKTFKCNTCDAKFAEKHKMNRHIAAVHEGKKPYKCGTCDSKFALRHDMYRHISSVHEGKKVLQM